MVAGASSAPENRSSPRSSSSSRPAASSAAKISGTDSADAGQMGGDRQERPDILGRRRVHQHRRARAAASAAGSGGSWHPAPAARHAPPRSRARARNAAIAASRFMRCARSGPASRTAPRGGCRRRSGCSATVSASAGRSAPSRSGHSTSTMSSRASSQPSSDQAARPVQPPQVEMMHRAERRVVALHQGEGRARHLQRRIAGGGAQEGAGERGLAGAELAFQQDRIARPRQGGHRGGERLGRREVGQFDRGGSRRRRTWRQSAASGGVADNRRARLRRAGAWQAKSTPT